jgi:hypothetical protein
MSPAASITADPAVLSRADWQARREAHARLLEPRVAPQMDRRSAHRPHPVYDFLFTYYSFRPLSLLAWSPGIGVTLEDAGEGEFALPGLAVQGGSARLDPEAFPVRRRDAAAWILRLLETTASHPPVFGCHGLHEWAMVYEAGAVRHEAYPLRMAPDELKRFVDSQAVCCSHFDAFRFFTEKARPLNAQQPSRDSRMELEQRGCVHVTMDLYKWAYKFWPWIPSDNVREAFLLAWDARELDMRASPYDLRGIGFEPVRIETPGGREEYRTAQQELARRAVPVRERLAAAYRALLDEVKGNE